MLVLAIDTATAATSVAAVAVHDTYETDEGAVTARAFRRHVDPRGHGEQLAGLVEEVRAEAGAARASFAAPGSGAARSSPAALVAGTGPGPYTGLRVGLTTAAVMAQALDVPAYGVCSLDGLGGATSGRVLVATDARRRELYWAVYADGRRLTEPAVGRPADVAAALPGYGVTAAYGEGALRYPDAFDVPVAAEPRYPDPVLLVQAVAPQVRAGGADAVGAAGAAAESLTPRYLRRPHAADPHGPKPVTTPAPAGHR